jgi:hypothetical protein
MKQWTYYLENRSVPNLEFGFDWINLQIQWNKDIKD